ncbi:hypothetical protein AG0111_0g12050 [Alternaria gaisen]|uniref:Uncharacterized protein n=1 Tax=Alternaria gaisen TaxID=167740 RepID=A0ACB6F5B4_9PLEO|nr:hypothetical protein AG0111_0g12050 [Alternaria gaisen]
MFTGEAHMALDDWILRVIVHFAAWVNYYTKAEKLTFYNDEYDDVEPVEPPPNPRQRPKTEMSKQYDDRVRQWEAEKAKIPVVTNPATA